MLKNIPTKDTKVAQKAREEILYMGRGWSKTRFSSRSTLWERDSNWPNYIERDHEVNRLDVDIDDICVRLLALHQPAGRDLRFITTGLKITTDLERIGDMAVNICERALELNQEPQLKPYIDIPRMARVAQRMIRESLDASCAGHRPALKVCRTTASRSLNSQIFREVVTSYRGDPHTNPSAIRSSRFEYLGASPTTRLYRRMVIFGQGEKIRHLQ